VKINSLSHLNDKHLGYVSTLFAHIVLLRVLFLYDFAKPHRPVAGTNTNLNS